jgi:hypothetical protein
MTARQSNKSRNRSIRRKWRKKSQKQARATALLEQRQRELEMISYIIES